MKTTTCLVALSIALALSAASAWTQTTPDYDNKKPAGVVAGVDRTVLPIAEPEYPTITEVDARKATPPRASK
jgi:hypothetical protein